MLTYNILNDVYDLGSVVDTFFGGVPSVVRAREYPSIRLYENNDTIEVTAIVPGITSEDLEVKLVDNNLLIEGKKNDENTDNVYIRRERLFGSFSRTIKLPYRVDAGKIKAELKNGILTVKLEKSEEAKPRKIEIN